MEYNITDAFCGGNIIVSKIEADTVYLRPDLRDTAGEWFYWAFCVEHAAGKTLTFVLEGDWVGYFGPAVSHDLQAWQWLGSREDGARFRYTFGAGENRVYFAHHMLYHLGRFYQFAEKNGLLVEQLCTSSKGRAVPCVRFGQGTRKMVLTARHHCCESTGNYVLEGVLTGLLQHPLSDLEVLCVPFVDFDGVIDGDQGKNRIPHDHYEDYMPNIPSIYPSVAQIREYLDRNRVVYGFDFHAPWHLGWENDTAFIVQSSAEKLEQLNRFGTLLEQAHTPDALAYRHEQDIAPNVRWNRTDTPTFANYVIKKSGSQLAFTLETTYFGTPDAPFTPDKAFGLGLDFCAALHAFDRMYS